MVVVTALDSVRASREGGPNPTGSGRRTDGTPPETGYGGP